MVKTQALVVAEKGAQFVLQDVEVAEPGLEEVLVKIVASGVCHTDIAIQIGAFPSPFPTIAGHEGAGIVQKVGTNVKGLKEGDQVLLSFASCQTCGYCEEGQPSMCATWLERNFGRVRDGDLGPTPAFTSSKGEPVHASFFGQSSFSKLALVSASSCVKAPAGADIKQLAPLGCGLQTGAGAVINSLKPGPNDSIAIFGLGAVGISALWAAAYLKVGTIIAVDLVPSKLELAKSFGATHVVNGKDADATEQIKKATKHGFGVRYAVEATGVTRVLKQAYDSLKNGGHVLSCGTPGPGVQPPIEIHDAVCTSRTWSALTEGGSNPPEFIPFLIDLYNKGQFPVDKISKYYQLADFDKALHDMHDGTTMKPIILFE